MKSRPWAGAHPPSCALRCCARALGKLQGGAASSAALRAIGGDADRAADKQRMRAGRRAGARLCVDARDRAGVLGAQQAADRVRRALSHAECRAAGRLDGGLGALRAQPWPVNTLALT